MLDEVGKICNQEGSVQSDCDQCAGVPVHQFEQGGAESADRYLPLHGQAHQLVIVHQEQQDQAKNRSHKHPTAGRLNAILIQQHLVIEHSHREPTDQRTAVCVPGSEFLQSVLEVRRYHLPCAVE